MGMAAQIRLLKIFTGTLGVIVFCLFGLEVLVPQMCKWSCESKGYEQCIFSPGWDAACYCVDADGVYPSSTLPEPASESEQADGAHAAPEPVESP